MTTAIIGAGISGLIVAGCLQRRGHEVTVFDKSRGVGGRCATRRDATSDPAHPRVFNHGVQLLTAKSAAFDSQLDHWAAAAVVHDYVGRLVRIGDGGVSPQKPALRSVVCHDAITALPKHLAHGVNVRTDVEVTTIVRDNDGYALACKSADTSVTSGVASIKTIGRFERVILAVPAPQAIVLLGEGHAFVEQIAGVQATPIWTLMTTVSTRVDFDAAHIDTGPLAWAMRTPGQVAESNPVAWTLHASAEWSKLNVEQTKENVVALLRDAVQALLQTDALHSIAAHRWRYAQTTRPLGLPHLLNTSRDLAVVGDWCLGDRVEHAWQSAMSLVEALR